MLGGHVIFCDDIRQEVGNKLTYVGRYQGTMELDAEVPAVLPKLGLVVVWTQSLDEELLPVDWELLVPGDTEPRAKGQFDLRSVSITESALSPEERILVMETSATLQPFHIVEDGDMRVTAKRGGRTIHLRRITINSKKAEPEPEKTEAP
ncbi:MAG: hypothetical protein EOO15_16795 [Chitinophagaceae bacterium]|nr:MAG: hypothetical protein EOO15_16795 [Chitinophagaceae bacterium]